MTDDSTLSFSSSIDSDGTPQHPLLISIFLHLFPGFVLIAFTFLAIPVVTSLGFPSIFALFIGIGLVIVPIELGVLFIHARSTTGSFRLDNTVLYRETLPLRKLLTWGAALAVWFLVFFAISTVFFDEWIAEMFFSWYPERFLEFAAVEDAGEPLTTSVLIVFLFFAFLLNGLVGPIVEEYYFRGYLLPRIGRYGRWAPLMNTILFSVYHFWTPWQNVGRIIGFYPIAWAARRFQSTRVAIVAHVTINLIGLLGMAALFLEAAA
ncbi:lysostaphin resistance A-like protein [Halorubrum sp. DTA98]|uniref:CPBP family intramembrane glutamic endopeptidase n=1 Tax=Halorubrum sp. DTA98 TaxID=3402163 RepID=UPI003AABFCBC